MKKHCHPFRLLTAISFIVVVFLTGCHKKAKTPEELAVERHEREVRQQNTEKKVNTQAWTRTPAARSTEDASKFLFSLIHSGKLPDTEDASSRVDFHVHANATNYPLSRTFNVKMKSTSFVNHYTVEKTSADSSWKLEKAWRTDAQGQTVKEYSLP